LHLSLRGWQQLVLAQRQALVRLGATELVDREQVVQLLAAHSADIRPTPLLSQVTEGAPSTELLDALPRDHGLDAERWLALSALDRYVLSQLARRGKTERLAEAFAEICG
jgi:DNA-binding NarL/FixJ family response regulator